MGLIDWLMARAPRERLLLAVSVLLALPLALGFGWLLPLHEARQEAEAALEEARALNLWVRERQGEIMVLAAVAPDGPDGRGGPVGASALEQSLRTARLRDWLSALETGGEGGIELSFDTVEFAPLMAWIETQETAGWGYRIDALRLERTERPAMVSARLVLAPVD